MAAELNHVGIADGKNARHHAGTAMGNRQVVTPPHLVDLTGEVEGDHRLPAGLVRGAIDRRHHRSNRFFERAGGAVGLQLVVLDEVDADIGQFSDQFTGCPVA